MFRSFSTRREKENKKKIPIVKAVIDEEQIVESFTRPSLSDRKYLLVIKPQFYDTFMKNHCSDGINVTLDLSYNSTYAALVAAATVVSGTNYGSIEVTYQKLTMFSTSTEIECKLTNRTSVSSIIITYGKDESDNALTKRFLNNSTSTVDELQIINATVPDGTTDLSTIKIEPVEWNDNFNFNSTVTNIRISGNYEKVKLTNLRYEELNSISGKYETNLVVKRNISGILRKMPIPITVMNLDSDADLKWKITSINEAVDTGIPVSEGNEETVKIGINNVGIADNANDSYIDFTQIELTEEQMTRTYWENFYVNKITRYSDQVFDFIFQGYRNTELEYATEEVINKIADVKDVEIKDIGYYTVLILTFEEGAPGFLGKTQRVKLPGLTEPQETVVIYLNEEMSAKVNNEVTKIKFVVEDMKAIVPGTNEDSVNLNLNFYTNRTPEGPTYVAVYHLNQYGTYSASALSISLFNQEITKLNTIYGTVKKNNGKKLIVPLDVDVDNVWSENKLNLKEIVTSGTNLTINEIKTTNCLAINAKLNIVVQNAIPIDWYKWLPLNEVYVDDNKNILVNPTSPGDYSSFTKIVSVNALPSDDIGIDTSTPSELDLSGIDLKTGEPL